MMKWLKIILGMQFISRILLPLFMISSVLMPSTAFSFEEKAIDDIPGKASLQLQEIRLSLEKSILTETETVNHLKEQLNRLKTVEKALDMEISAYQIQNSTYTNLLHLATIEISDLHRAELSCRAVLDSLAERMRDLNQKRNYYNKLLADTENQYIVNEKQLSTIKTEQYREKTLTVFPKQLGELLKIISEKRQILREIQALFTQQINRQEEIRRDFETLLDRLQGQLELRRKQDLMKRSISSWGELIGPGIGTEFSRIKEQLGLLVKPSFYIEQRDPLRRLSNLPLAAGTAFLLFILFMIRWGRQRCRIHQEKLVASAREFPFWCLVVQLVQRSLPLAGFILFIYVYGFISNLNGVFSFLQTVIDILTIFLLSGVRPFCG